MEKKKNPLFFGVGTIQPNTITTEADLAHTVDP